MGGNITAHTAQVLGPLMGEGEMAKVRNNATAPEERLKLITKALERMEPAAKAAGQTWSAQMDTFKDSLGQVAMVATTPLFDAWSAALRQANGWLAKNRDMLMDADKAGQRAIKVWETMVAHAKTLVALSAAGAIAGVAGKSGMLGAVGTAVGGAGAGGLAAAAGALGVVASAGYALATALQNHPELMGRLTSDLEKMAQAGGKLLDSFGSLVVVGGPLDQLGTGLVYVLDGTAAVATGLIRVAAAFGEVLALLGGQASDNLGRAADVNLRSTDSMKDAMGANWNALFGSHGLGEAISKPWQGEVVQVPPSDFMSSMMGFESGPKAEKPETKKEIPDKGMKLTGPITIHVNVEQASDPYRVAISMGAALSNIEKYRGQATSVRPR
jgi:hypothetical protein